MQVRTTIELTGDTTYRVKHMGGSDPTDWFLKAEDSKGEWQGWSITFDPCAATPLQRVHAVEDFILAVTRLRDSIRAAIPRERPVAREPEYGSAICANLPESEGGA